MRLKSRHDLLHQIYRMAEFDRVNNGNIWYASICAKNTDRCNNVLRIFQRYQRNIEDYFGREHLPHTFNLSKDEIYTKLPRKKYAGF